MSEELDSFELETLEKDTNLWLTLKLKNQQYAIDSSYTESIFLLGQMVTPLPESTAQNPGIINMRGNLVPVIDLRVALGFEAITQEQEEMEYMLNQRIQDHIEWVTELERCLDEDDTFHLATDPHACAFGQWYDSYQTNVNTVAYHLRKIDEPHRKLHQTAIETFACPRHCDTCTRDTCLQTKLRTDAKKYRDTVVSLLEETKTVFRENIKTMCVVISDFGEKRVGLLVDEIIAVETLTMKTLPDDFRNRFGSNLISGIGEKEGATVLLLNEENLFAL